MLVVTRFDVAESDAPSFLPRAQAALAAFAARPGYLRGRIGRAADDPGLWVLSTEWDGVGAYRRSLGDFQVKVDAAPLLAQGRDEPSAFEVLHRDDGGNGQERTQRQRRGGVSVPGSPPVDQPPGGTEHQTDQNQPADAD